MFYVIDAHTGIVVGRAKSRSRARRRVDELDNAYGGYRYCIRELPITNTEES